jgi:ABC-type Zn uptake system ZnuABC Zn-binding protein ZnuA
VFHVPFPDQPKGQSFMSLPANSRIHRLGGQVFSGLLMLTLVLAGLPAISSAARAQDDDPLRVVATFSILGDWVTQVGGDRIEVATIVPAGGDAHTFDPNPDQVTSIADADLIFEIGIGFETWLDDMYAASGSNAQRIVVSDGLDLISATEEGHEDELADEASPAAGAEPEGEEEDHAHGDVDPHIWHDVNNAVAGVETIRAALGSADGAARIAPTPPPTTPTPMPTPPS